MGKANLGSGILTPEREERARQLWNDGLSGEQVAAAMGGGCTKNVIMGLQKRRLGWDRHAPAIVMTPEQYAERSRRSLEARQAGAAGVTGARKRSRAARPRIEAPPPPAPLPEPPAPRPPAQPAAVRVRRCQFIEGEVMRGRPPLMCGRVAEFGRPYCLGHCRVTYIGYLPYRSGTTA